jgi:hypothetical protein
MLLNKKISVWYFIREIKSQILFIGIFAVAIGLLDMLPWFRKISLPLNIPALLGTGYHCCWLSGLLNPTKDGGKQEPFGELLSMIPELCKTDYSVYACRRS